MTIRVVCQQKTVMRATCRQCLRLLEFEHADIRYYGIICPCGHPVDTGSAQARKTLVPIDAGESE